MDPIELLTTDHENLRQLMKQSEETEEAPKKAALFNRIRLELAVHEVIEEELFYPACRAKPKAKEMVLEGIEEHHVVDDLMGELSGIRPENETWDAKFDVMRENVEHHMEEEETELFPKARELFEPDELSRLGDQMSKRKKVAAEELSRVAPAP